MNIIKVRVVRYDHAAKRVWVLNARIHHGLVGVGLVVLGGVLIYTDWPDRPWLHD